MTTTPEMDDATLIADSVRRLFADHVDAGVRHAAERGEWPAALWQRVVEGGYPRLLATEAGGGLAAPWAVAWPP